ncbi:hypothetical protein ACIBI9_64470 [Nonomuraea sp. NPDC050451]
MTNSRRCCGSATAAPPSRHARLLQAVRDRQALDAGEDRLRRFRE